MSEWGLNFSGKKKYGIFGTSVILTKKIYELRVWDTNKTMAKSGIINVGRTYSKLGVGIKKNNFLGVV